jgi:hypothetical protein
MVGDIPVVVDFRLDSPKLKKSFPQGYRLMWEPFYLFFPRGEQVTILCPSQLTKEDES